MFTALHALAKQATLLITIAAEGDDQLRVNVTPMPFDDKAKAQLPKPLSLLASPAEFDADFIAALTTWQAPKRTLLEQAQATTGDDEPATPAAKAPAKKDKAGAKAAPRAGKPVAAEPESAGVQAAGEAAGEEDRPGRPVGAGEAEPGDNPGPVAAEVADAPAIGAGGGAPESSDEPQPADALTLDLF